MAKISPDKIRKAAADVARVASVMFDGEVCGQIVTARSWEWVPRNVPGDWQAHDNYDVEHAPFVAAKQTLLRLEKLAPPGIKLGCNLWVVVPTMTGHVACVVHNGTADRWQKFADMSHKTTPEMAAALAGQQADVPDDASGMVTVLAPVRDSFKQVTGFVEVSGTIAPPVLPW